MKSARTLLLIVVLAIISGTIYYIESHKPERKALSKEVEIVVPQPEPQPKAQPAAPRPAPVKGRDLSAIIKEKANKYDRAKELVDPNGYINVGPDFTLRSLVGKKVIMVDFWTYSCINCQRTTPYLNAWYDKYSAQGLEIVGVHTPEFDFEKKYDNVLAAVKKFNIKYPVVLDNDYLTWRAYRNRYWPQKYLIDIDGFIVYQHIGEGGYEETEARIRELLKERAGRLGLELSFDRQMVKPERRPEVEYGKVKSPEIYFGSRRNENLGNGTPYTAGEQSFTRPENVELNKLYFMGKWLLEPQYAQNLESSGGFIFRYNSRNVFLVAEADQPVKVRVLRDGQPLGEERGADIDPVTSSFTVKDSQLYKIIEDRTYGEHTLEFIIESPGMRIYTFTFG